MLYHAEVQKNKSDLDEATGKSVPKVKSVRVMSSIDASPEVISKEATDSGDPGKPGSDC